MYRVLTNKYSIRDAHSRYFTPFQSKRIGDIGESAFLIKNKNQKILRCNTIGQHLQVPFIISQCDFRTQDIDNDLIIEIKTTKDSIFGSIPLNIITQIWITMDSFRVNMAQLVVYKIKSAEDDCQPENSKDLQYFKKCPDTFQSKYNYI